MLEWEGGRKARDDRIRGLESQKKALIEKSDLTQVLILHCNHVLNIGLCLNISYNLYIPLLMCLDNFIP